MLEILGINYGSSYKFKEGTKIKFTDDKRIFTVKASNIMFSICTSGRYYTIINWFEKVRGPENLVFPFGASNKKEQQEMLERLTNGDSEVTYRNRVNLSIELLEDAK